jgi:hypothetical protein
MLAIQSMEGPPRPLPGPPPPLVGPESTEVRQPKPKTLPCKYCSKRFRRVEHVQRHERTHTKEKPFSCGWDRCGKTFGRRYVFLVPLYSPVSQPVPPGHSYTVTESPLTHPLNS